MASPTRVAITGGGGLIGGVLGDALSTDYDITAVDRTATSTDVGDNRSDGVAPITVTVADSTDLDALRRALEGHDVIVDLAASVGGPLGWPEVYRNSVAATYHALQAAHDVGARRLVFASSNHATGLYERDDPFAAIVAGRYDGLQPGKFERVAADWPVRPDSPYGVAKAFGEAAGRFFADDGGLSVLCMRIGTVTAENRPGSVRGLATLLTHADLVRLVRCCIEAPPERMFGIYYGVSNNTWRFWDLSNAEREVGYQPQDDAEQWRADIQA